MKKVLLVASLIVCFSIGNTFAIPITSTISLEGLGSFSGDFEYAATSNTTATINMSLTNTSSSQNGGLITAFAFNNPNGSITSASLSSTSSNFVIIGDPQYNSTIPANPFGDFDIGSASTTSWLAGGNPNGGIAAGDTEMFLFSLIGSDMDLLSNQDFFTTFSTGSNSGQEQWLAARFRGFIDGGSDKVPAAAPVPEPATMLLLGSGLIGIAAARRKKLLNN